jgi:hypothetical protein
LGLSLRDELIGYGRVIDFFYMYPDDGPFRFLRLYVKPWYKRLVNFLNYFIDVYEL